MAGFGAELPLPRLSDVAGAAPNRPFIERTFGQCVDLEIADLRYTGSCPG
jgi:hypothetical protein